MYLILPVYSTNQDFPTPDYALVEWSDSLRTQCTQRMALAKDLQALPGMDMLYSLEFCNHEANYLQTEWNGLLFPEEYGEEDTADPLQDVTGTLAYAQLRDQGYAVVATLPAPLADAIARKTWEHYARVDCATMVVTENGVEWHALWGDDVAIYTLRLRDKAFPVCPTGEQTDTTRDNES